jgi:hypothetical protein
VLASEEGALENHNQEALSAETLKIKRTKELGYLVSLPSSLPPVTSHNIPELAHQGGKQSVRKIPGVIHPKPWDTIIRATKIFAYPTVVISTFSFVFFQYWWSVTSIHPSISLARSLVSCMER